MTHSRIRVPGDESILNTRMPVLDQGFVRLEDYMGSDASIVRAARVSYGGATGKTAEEDAKLLEYLLTNKHMSPFEMVSLVFHIKIPLFVFAQMVRHRTAKLNSKSARYSEMSEEFYIPELDRFQSQDKKNKQGSGEPLSIGLQSSARTIIAEHSAASFKTYKDLLDLGVSKEIARVVLSQNLYTEIYWNMDLRNLLHFLELRLDTHAQWEIRQYAQAVANITAQVAPVTWGIWARLNGIAL